MSNLYALDETLDFLNNKDTESTNESVLGTIAGVLIAPYLFVALCALILGLISSIKNVKYKNMIFKNPEVTSSIKVFGKRLQEQIKKSMSKHSRYFKAVGINVDSKNINKDKVTVVLGEFDYGLNPEDLYEAVAPTIYDEMDEDERIDRFGEDCSKEDAIKSILNNPNYFECDYGDFIDGGSTAVENIIKEKYPELIDAIDTVNKAVADINNFINSKANTKGIYVTIAGNSKLSLDDLLDNHFADTIKISLVIKYQDYSRIKLPEETQKEIEKISGKKN